MMASIRLDDMMLHTIHPAGACDHPLTVQLLFTIRSQMSQYVLESVETQSHTPDGTTVRNNSIVQISLKSGHIRSKPKKILFSDTQYLRLNYLKNIQQVPKNEPVQEN